MKVKIEMDINPFSIPSFVTVSGQSNPRQDGFKPAEDIPLFMLDEYTLDKLCDDFRDSVFKKAGKSQPPRCAS